MCLTWNGPNIYPETLRTKSYPDISHIPVYPIYVIIIPRNEITPSDWLRGDPTILGVGSYSAVSLITQARLLFILLLFQEFEITNSSKVYQVIYLHLQGNKINIE